MTDQRQLTPELEAVLQHQQATATAQTGVTQLLQAIAAQQGKAETMRAKHEGTTVLETEREDLLADIATGSDKAAELKALDARLAQHKKDVAEQGSQAAIGQTVAGLTRKLERAQAELAELQGQRPVLLRRLLLANAEELGSAYVTTARQLKALHGRLAGLSSMLNGLGSPPVLDGARALIEIPAPDLESVKPHVSYINPNMLIARDHDRQPVMRAVEQEKAALQALGVEIS